MESHGTTQMSRRRFLSSATLATSAIGLLPRWAFAEEGPVAVIRHASATADFVILNLRGNISVLVGSGGKLAVLPEPDGKLLVDTGITASRPKITEALRKSSPDPVTHLLTTHWHFDLRDGNEWLNSVDAQITANENALKHLTPRHPASSHISNGE